MAHIFELVNQLFAQVVPVADFLWDFPTNIDAYANIPILGQLSIAFLLLLGGSLYFTLRFGFVQVKEFKTGIRLLTSKQQAKVGTSQLAAFLVSMGGRVGAGNIVGVTGAVTIGGPGAIFWMWVSAFLGMATSFCEATLAQIFKERKGNEYVGGFTFYIQKIWKNKAWIGAAMCIMYLIYNMLSIPVHTFHVFTESGGGRSFRRDYTWLSWNGRIRRKTGKRTSGEDHRSGISGCCVCGIVRKSWNETHPGGLSGFYKQQ